MKRAILKLVPAIFTALGLFILYLLTCFPLLNTTVFRWKEDKGGQDSGSQVSCNINNSCGGSNVSAIVNNKSGSGSNSSDSKINILTFDFENPVNPEISDYIIVSITAKNAGPAKYPYGSIAINLSGEKTEILNGAALGSEADDVKDNETVDATDDKASSKNSADDRNTGLNIAGSPVAYKIQERTRIFVDGIRHNYYIPVGENKYWRHDWNLYGPTLKEQIGRLEIEIPKIEGVDIQITGISLNKRLIFTADSYVNYFFKSYFQLSYIDRYLTPIYIFLIFFIAVFFVFRFLLNKENNIRAGKTAEISGIIKSNGLKTNGPKSSTLQTKGLKPDLIKPACLSESSTGAEYKFAGFKSSKKNRVIKKNKFNIFTISFKTSGLLIPLLLLIFFSFYFINNYIFTVKGYWDSYKQYIVSGRLDETYYGFSDFNKFVIWVDGKVPEGNNIIVLVKGEPVYIMARMAYGLYPKDIKFIDIGRMSADETADKIMSLNFAESLSENTVESANSEADRSTVGKNNTTGLNNNNVWSNSNIGLNISDGARTYEYIVVLSETDKEFLKSVKVKLEYSYRENAGFIYKLILK